MLYSPFQCIPTRANSLANTTRESTDFLLIYRNEINNTNTYKLQKRILERSPTEKQHIAVETEVSRN